MKKDKESPYKRKEEYKNIVRWLKMTVEKPKIEPSLPKEKVLVACEFSGIARNALLKRGVNAVSCDILPSETEGSHIQGDVLEHLDGGWTTMIAFPPCTHLAVSGARWFKDKLKEQQKALDFVRLQKKKL